MQHTPEPLAADTVWTPKTKAPTQPYAQLGLRQVLGRGAACRCPSCGKTKLVETWLRQVPVCTACRAPLGRIRADDAPPYFTIFFVAHLIIGLQLALERVAPLSVAAELALFLPLTLALTIGLIRPVKGATIGLMLKLGMAERDEDAQPGHA